MKRSFFLVVTVLLVYAESGGPDHFGYTWIDSRAPGGPAFEWIEIKDTGTLLTSVSSADDGEQIVPLERPFIFYDTEQNTITVSSNGSIAFGSYSYIPYYMTSFPSPDDPNNVIACLWTDLNPSSSPTPHGIYYQDFGTYCVIEWYRISEISYSANEHTFQIVLYFGSKSIFINYLAVTTMTSHNAYIGIENGDGTDGLLCGNWSSSGGLLEDSLSIRFRATPTASAPYFNDLTTDEDIQYDEEGDSGWEWGVPTVGPSAAHSETHCLGTTIDGNYEPDADWVVTAPDLDLGTLSYPVLDFYSWYSTESGVDGGICEISTNDGSSWIYIEPEDGYPATFGSSSPLSGLDGFTGSSDGWEYVSFDLSDFEGTQSKFRMRFVSNGSTQMPGWYIDDIGLHEQYGVIKGRCDLAYVYIDGGIEVTLVELGRHLVTDDEGNFTFDSVKVGDNYTVRFFKDDYLPDSTTGVAVTRLDTTYIEKILSPEPYSSDFAENGGGWVATPAEGGWEWGSPIPLGEPSLAHSDSFLWGTNLDGSYPNDTILYLDLSINLGYLERPALRFWQWYRLSGEFAGNLFDGANVKISNDGGETWELVMPDLRYDRSYDGIVSSHNRFIGGEYAFGGDSYGDYWHYVTFDLMPWAFQEVIIRFELAADGMGNNRGWYIDDVSIADNWEAINETPTIPKTLDITAHPNPFNAACQISVPEGFTANIYDIHARHIQSLPSGTSIWNADGQPSGVYLVRAQRGDKVVEKRVVLVR